MPSTRFIASNRQVHVLPNSLAARIRMRGLCAIVFCALMFVELAWAQTTSTIQGRVTDQTDAAIPGATIKVVSPSLAIERQSASGADGSYRIVGLPAGTYNVIASKAGFATANYKSLEITLNKTLEYNIVLSVGTVVSEVDVTGSAPILETTTSASAATITPRQIHDVPLNGRNYLDLLQLVPGVAVNRQANEGTDAATPVLGERGNNAVYLIDGMPNEESLNGGASAQFDQDSILEFQVLTGGYKAEFGHGSGGVVNVVTKSGTNNWHGMGSVFMRNNVLDTSDKPNSSAPFLIRWDPSVTLGGPIKKDRIFFFGSLERIRESRELNFVFPTGVPAFMQARELGYDKHNQTYETRGFAKLDEQLGHHRLTQQMNLTNGHVTDFLPLSQVTNLPSTRSSFDSRNLMLGLSDTFTFGNQSNPFLITAYAQYRGEPNDRKPSHPEAGPLTSFGIFSSLAAAGTTLGDLGVVTFGSSFTPARLHPKYVSTGVNIAKQVNRHNLKFGWQYEHTHVDGLESSNVSNQVYTTIADFLQFGPVYGGWGVPNVTAGPTTADNLIRLRNSYNGLYAQDDWNVTRKLTLNYGLRWDYDTTFPNKANFGPRVGFAWQVSPKTVVRGSFGMFYDHFRLGVARDIPAFGGANLIANRSLSYPRLFYYIPTNAPFLLDGLCISPTLTDAQINAAGMKCKASPSSPFFGIDHLSNIVASGHAPIPANVVVTKDNIQQLSGLTPDQYLLAVDQALGRNPSAAATAFLWSPFGTLASQFRPQAAVPITVDPKFHTPYTRAYNLSVQREISPNVVVEADFYHRNIKNILGTRQTNLDFSARLTNNSLIQPGTGKQLINQFGPWYSGRYDAFTVGIRKHMSRRFTLDANYTFSNEVDNAANSSFRSELQSGGGANTLPQTQGTDTFVGIVPHVTVCGQDNATAPFIISCGRGTGNPVPLAGSFYYGPNLDKGNSDLALAHTFLVHGMVQLPRGFEVSSIFRAQSGFHFTQQLTNSVDVDGNGTVGGYPFVVQGNKIIASPGRNAFTAPPFVNMDVRFTKTFKVTERVNIQGMFEFFNLFNNGNPAAVQTRTNIAAQPFGSITQVLPGREGQVGLRIEF